MHFIKQYMFWLLCLPIAIFIFSYYFPEFQDVNSLNQLRTEDTPLNIWEWYKNYRIKYDTLLGYRFFLQDIAIVVMLLIGYFFIISTFHLKWRYKILLIISLYWIIQSLTLILNFKRNYYPVWSDNVMVAIPYLMIDLILFTIFVIIFYKITHSWLFRGIQNLFIKAWVTLLICILYTSLFFPADVNIVYAVPIYVGLISIFFSKKRVQIW